VSAELRTDAPAVDGGTDRSAGARPDGATSACPDPCGAPAVELIDVSKHYGPAESGVRALRGVSASIRAGESVALLGKSGSGKSTLLNLLGGLDRPTTGVVRVMGRDLAGMSADELSDYRLKTVGMIFQSFHLIPTRTAVENVELPLVFAGRPRRRRRAAAAAALEAVGMSHRLHHRPSQLSGGEQQRTAIARALVNDPALLLVDEPTGNLDSDNAEVVLEVLLRCARGRGATMVLVTHDPEIGRRCADRILRMKDGAIAAE
jgi:ABC-type lipoprotein export system ATPase subunit